MGGKGQLRSQGRMAGDKGPAQQECPIPNTSNDDERASACGPHLPLQTVALNPEQRAEEGPGALRPHPGRWTGDPMHSFLWLLTWS